jgi:hypothetical protein
MVMGNDRDQSAGASDTGEKQTNTIKKDAEGQFVGTQHGGDSDGVVSAKPTAITGSEDATVNKWRPEQKDPPDDWDANFDLGDRDNS